MWRAELQDGGQVATESGSVRLRVTSKIAPERHEGRATEFGLQDKKKNLQRGEPTGRQLLRFDIEALATLHESGRPRFRGVYVHNGAKGAQHLYIGWRYVGEPTWINRLKVHLDMSWDDVQSAIDDQSCLVADGTGPEWGVLKDWHGLGVGRQWDKAER